MVRTALKLLIVLCVFLESSTYLFLARWMTSEYLRAHATLLQALQAGSSAWINGLLLLLAAGAYGWLPVTRPPLRMIAIVVGFIAFYDYTISDHLVRSYIGVFHGDVVAISAASGMGLVLIGLLTAIDHFTEKAGRKMIPSRVSRSLQR